MISSKALHITSISLVMGGAFLLAWFGWVKLKPGSPLYQYQLLAEGGLKNFLIWI